MKNNIASPSMEANDNQKKTRVVVFGSFYRGYHILSNLLNDKELMKRVEIVGVATDDPNAKWVSAGKRVWQYPHTDQEEKMVEELAKKHGIHVYKGRVKPLKDDGTHSPEEIEKSREFYDILQNKWKPDIIYMGTFGQLLDSTIINTPPMGVFNAHPADGVNWPSCVGPNPFEQMFEAKNKFCAIALHSTNEQFDNGQLACFSEKVDIPYEQMKDMPLGEQVVHMHRITSPYAGRMINSHLRSQIGMPLTQAIEHDVPTVGYSDKITERKIVGWSVG